MPRTKKHTPKRPIPASRPKKHTFDGYKPKKIAVVIDDNYIEYKNEGVEDLSNEQYLEKNATMLT